jgi:hypothetical protein
MPGGVLPLGAALRAIAPVVVLAGVVTLLRIAYLMFFCPYTLIEDEAQYWVWSTRLDWSYSTKGPGVAGVIWLSTHLFGTNAEWAVRLPAAIAMGIAPIATALLAVDITRSPRAACYAGVALMIVPAYLAMALLMTIDGWLIACWAIAACAAHRAGVLRSTGWMLCFGVAVGVGILFKHTMALVVPGIVWWLWSWRRELRPRVGSLLLAGLVVVACCVPMVVWNAQHDWSTLRHFMGHLGLAGGDTSALVAQGGGGEKLGWHYSPLWTLTFLGSLLGLLGPVVVIGVVAGWKAWQRREPRNARWRGESFLLATSLPLLGFYLVVSQITEPEGNWPIAAGVGLSVLAGWRAQEAFARTPRPRRSWTRTIWSAAVLIGLVGGVGMLRLDWLERTVFLKHVVPVGRFTSADEMGRHAGRMLEQLRAETGQEPFLMAQHYGRASQLWYYTPGQPVTYCASSLVGGGRKTPWDYWRDTNLRMARPELVGRPALVVGASRADWAPYFDRVREFGALEGDHKLRKDGTPTRPAYLCEGFRGLVPPAITPPQPPPPPPPPPPQR